MTEPNTGLVESQASKDMGVQQRAKALAAVAKLTADIPPEPAKAASVPAKVQEQAQEGAETGQQATKEAPPAPTPLEKSKAEALAEIARGEAGLKRQRDQLAAESKALKDQQAEADKIHRLQALVTKDPVAAFKELGLTPHYAAITDALLKEPEGPPDPLVAKVKNLEDALATERQAREQTEAQRVQREQDAQIQQIQAGFKEALDNDERFPLLRKVTTEPHKAVWNHIVSRWNQAKVALTLDEAAQEIEDQFSAIVQAAAEKDPVGEEPPAKGSKQEPRKTTPVKKPPVSKSASPKTLNNGMTPANGGTALPELPVKWDDRVKAIAERVKALT